MYINRVQLIGLDFIKCNFKHCSCVTKLKGK